MDGAGSTVGGIGQGGNIVRVAISCVAGAFGGTLGG